LPRVRKLLVIDSGPRRGFPTQVGPKMHSVAEQLVAVSPKIDLVDLSRLRTPDTVELGWTQRGENEPQVGAWKEGLRGREFLAEINEHCIVRRRAQAMEPHV